MRYTEITAIAWIIFLLAILFGMSFLVLDVGFEMVGDYLDRVNGLGLR